MRRLITLAGSMMLAMAMLMAPDMSAQTRGGSGSGSRSTGQSTRSSGSSSTTRSSGSSSSSTRSSGSSTSGTRSSGSSVSSSSRSGSSSATRSSGSSVSSSSQQDRRTGSGSSSTGSSTRSTSSSSSSSTRSSSSYSSGSSTRSTDSGSGSVRSTSGSSSAVRSTGNSSSGSNTRAAGTSAQDDRRGVTSTENASVSGQARSSSNVTRSGLSAVASSESVSASQGSAYRDDGYNYRYSDDMRVDDRHNMYRVPPRQREPMAWDRPGYFWGDHPHYYGYRINRLPSNWRRISHWGIDYYYYNGIYYRHYGGSYVVCRPPFGTPLEHAIDRAILRAIRFAYYCDTYRTYESAFDYYNIIARQNLIIAQQNAQIIAQNAAYAINANRALTAYELANKLGLVQSYANANAEYFYQDGVFYTISASGVYTTIVPPAGALVTSLPDDYETIVMNGIEYYMVDNTVYRTTLFEGVPYLEVLGQMYGSMYNQYNVYR